MLCATGITARVASVKEAYASLYGLFQSLLDSDQYIEAALLIWGRDLFNPEPESVQRIWKALMTEPKVLIPGGGSQGKSYTPAAWAVLNWVRDPAWTSGKVISVTAGHAGANLMASIKNFHEMSALDLPGNRMDTGIYLGLGDKRASIALMAIPTGDDGKGRLRGFHPVLRPIAHRQFGRKSRLFALIDEGEDAPHGLWEGLENMLSTQSARGKTNLITIASGANPKKRESPYGQRAEPPGGWEKFDIDTSLAWYGPEAMGRWFVVRLDPSKSENVVEKREVYPGMMTYEGYMNYYKQGTNSAAYLTFGRGAWPTGATEFYITPHSFFNNAIGIYTFAGMPTPVASLDPAFAEGGDAPLMTTGRFGVVTGFTPFGGTHIPFEKPFNGLQIEQQFMLKKDNTLIMADECVNYLNALKIRPEWFIVDCTGNGLGIHDALKIKFGDVLGVHWSGEVTEKRILEEDSQTAEERFSGVGTEMMWAFATWLQYGYIKLAPMFNPAKLISQATGRKFSYDGRGKIKAQTKIDYKTETGGSSPDEYDSAIMMVHLIRIRKSQNAAMLPDRVAASQGRLGERWGGAGGTVDVTESYEIS